MRKLAYNTLGWAALVSGLIGVVLPGLPTTPFLLVAAFAFSRGSPKMRAWLINHARFGPMIADWEKRGAISRRAKTLAVGFMALVFGISLALGLPIWALTLQGICLVGAATFVVSRPE